MRIVVDTNVFVSGVFFTGPPYEILNAWRHGRAQLVVSPEILAEYRRVGGELGAGFPEVDIGPIPDLLTVAADIVDAPPLPRQVCTDADDDKFLACAIASRTKIIASGDKALLRASGHRGIIVLRPREFIEKHLR